VVSPDGHLGDVSDLGVSLKGKLGKGTVVIETGHGSEVLSGEAGSVMLADKGVGVGGVADNDGLDITSAVVVDGLAGVNENSTVVLKEITTFHSGAAGLGTNEEVEVNILESSGQVRSNNNIVEEGESAIVELSLDTLEDLFLEGEIEQVQDDTLVLAKEFARGNSEDDRVGDLTGSTGDENALGFVIEAGVERAH